MSTEKMVTVVNLLQQAREQDSVSFTTLASLAIANTRQAFLQQKLSEEHREAYELIAARVINARLPQWIQEREQTPPDRLPSAFTNFARSAVNITPTVFLWEQAAQGNIQAQETLLAQAEGNLYRYFHPTQEEPTQPATQIEKQAVKKLRNKLIPHISQRIKEDNFLQTITSQEINTYARATGFTVGKDIRRNTISEEKRQEKEKKEEQAERMGRRALPFHTILYIDPDFPYPSLHEQDNDYQYRLTGWMKNNGLTIGKIVNEIGFRAKLLHYTLKGLSPSQIETVLESSTTEESINTTISLLRKDLIKFIQVKNADMMQLQEYEGTPNSRRGRGREQISPFMEEIKYAIITGACEGLEVLGVFFVNSAWIQFYQENKDIPLKPSELKKRMDKYVRKPGMLQRNTNRLVDLDPSHP